MNLLSCELCGQPVSRSVKSTPEEPPMPCPAGLHHPLHGPLQQPPPRGTSCLPSCPSWLQRSALCCRQAWHRPLQHPNRPCVEGASPSPWFCPSGLEEPWGVIRGQRKALGQGETELPCESCHCPFLGVSQKHMCISPGQRQDVNVSL